MNASSRLVFDYCYRPLIPYVIRHGVLMLVFGALVLPLFLELGVLFLSCWALSICLNCYQVLCAPKWLQRLRERVTGFQAIHTRRVSCYFAPTLNDKYCLSIVAQGLDSAVDELSAFFGAALSRRVVVWLMPSYRDMEDVFSEPTGGRAFPAAYAIAITDEGNFLQIARHEIAHLFSFRIGPKAPALFSEGLSSWLEGPTRVSIDVNAKQYLTLQRVELSSLLDDTAFYKLPTRHSSYCLACSFTAFLVRQFGWDTFRSFYRKVARDKLKVRFRKVFGIEFEDAEAKWRDSLALVN